MENNNRSNVWKIILISLLVAAVVGVGVFFLVKYLKKRKAKKHIILEWDDEDAFEKCMNGHHDGEVVVVSAAE